MKAFFSAVCAWLRDVLAVDGNQSSMRLVLLAAWGCVLGVWTILCLWRQAVLPIDATVLTLLGIPTAGKVVQAHLETR